MSPATGPLNKRIGRFEIQAEVGRGGFGKVYRAFDPKVARTVAIKVLESEGVLESDGTASKLSRFRIEATAAGNLHHKNIVTIHEFGEDAGVQYLVMEYLDGQDLQKTLKSHKPLTLLDKMTVMSQVAEGLHCAHRSGVLHRDIKPANIMLLSDGGVKIMDFGIARLTRDDSTRLTQQGYLIGTVLYMAPELLLGCEVDVLCDVWSYGVIYYELLAGRNPFETGNIPAEIYKITREDPPALTSEQCPEALQSVIRRILSKDREVRYQSLEDIQFDTEPILRDLQRLEAKRLIPQARELCAQGEWEAAQPLIRSILELDPPSQEARVLREQIQREVYKRTVRPRVEALVRKGDEEALRRHFTEAIELLDSARKLDSTDEKLQARLENLRAAKERNDRAQRLISDARHELKQNHLTNAFEHASEALRTDPEFPEAAQLLAQIQQEIKERDKERNIQAVLHKSRGLIALESFDDAIALLTELDAAHPRRGEIKDLITRTVGQRTERERRRRLTGGLASAKELLKAGELSECLQLLTGLARDCPNDPEVSELVGYVRQELKTRERVQAVESLNREVTALLETHQYDRALGIVQGGLRSYPDEIVLSRLLRSVLSIKQAYEKERALEDGLRRIDDLRQRGQWQEALRVVSALLEQNPNDPELLRYARQFREEKQKQERAEALGRNLQNARALLGQERAAEAVELLQAALKLHVGDPELTDLLRRATETARDQETRSYIESQLAAASDLERRQDWLAALDCIRTALQRYPARPELTEAQSRVEAAMRRAERAGRIAAEKASIETHTAAGSWDAALARIQAARDAYPDEESFLRLSEDVQRRRGEEIRAAVTEARKSLLAGQVAEAEKIFRARLDRYSAEREVRAFAGELALEKIRHEELKRLDDEKRNYILTQLAMVTGYQRTRNWPAALQVARTALQRFPEDTELLAAQRQIEDAMQREGRDRQIAAEIETIRRLLAQGNWRSAMAQVQLARQQYGDEQFAQLGAEAQEQKARELNAFLMKVRDLFSRGEVDTADATLRAGSGIFSGEPEFDTLLAQIAQELARRDAAIRAEQEKQAYIAAQIARSKECQSRGEHLSAIEVIRQSLKRYPTEPVFLDELRSCEEAGQQFERQRKIKAALATIDQDVSKGKWDAAFAGIRKAEAEFSGEPVFPQLFRQVEEKRKAEIDGLVARARGHLASGELDQAENVVRKPLKAYAQEPAVISIADEIAAERFCREREALARKQIAGGRFPDATRSIQEIVDRQPNRASVVELRATLEDADRRKRLQAEIARLTELRRKGAIEEVRAGALQFLATVDDRQVRELLTWAESEAAKPKSVPESVVRQPAVPSPKKNFPWVLAGAAFLGALAIVTTVLYVTRAAPLSVQPVALQFQYQIGGAPVSAQPVRLAGGPSRARVQSGADWLITNMEGEGTSHAIVNVHVNPTGLKAGDYQTSLVILAGKTNAKTVDVKLTVRESPAKVERASAPPPLPVPPPVVVPTAEPVRVVPHENAKQENAKIVPAPPRPRPTKTPATNPEPAVPREDSKLQAQVPRPVQPEPQKLQAELPKPQPDPPRQAIPVPPIPEAAPPQSFIPKFGTITWAGELPSNEDLTITGNSASTGRMSGERLPPRTAVEVNLIESPGVNILALPNAANQYTLRLRNTSDRPTKYIRIRWTAQK